MTKGGKMAVTDLDYVGDGNRSGRLPWLNNYASNNNSYNPHARMELSYDNVIRTNFSNMDSLTLVKPISASASGSFSGSFNNNTPIMLHTTATNADNCIIRSSSTPLTPSEMNDLNKSPWYHNCLSSDCMNTFASSVMKCTADKASFHTLNDNKGINCNSNNHGGSLVLDSARGELVSASTIMTRKDVDAKAMAALKIHSEAERRRRERINSHLATLRDILPSSIKTDKATLLAEVIVELKRLKRKLSDVYQCDSDNLIMPTENNELKVEKDQLSAKDRVTLRVSLCCDDRPELLREIKHSLDTLELQTLKVYISTLGGRIKNVFILALKEHEKFMNGEQDFPKLIKQVEAVLKPVIENKPERHSGELELLQYKQNTRQRLINL